MIFVKNIFIFIFLLSLTACWGPSKKKESLLKGFGSKTINATFRVAEANSISAIPQFQSGVWKVPYSLRYKFRIKIISHKNARAVIGHQFYIKTETGKLIKENTKASGWLEWHEDIFFNFFSNQPSYLVLKREIIGRGLHQGVYPIELAVNPWAIFRSKYKSFVHLDKRSRLPQHLLSFGGQQVLQSKQGVFEHKNPYPLDIASAKVFISQLTEHRNHVNLEVKLEMNLLAKMKDAYGENILYKLKSGKVRAFVSLMATNIGKHSNEHAILFHAKKPLFVQFTAQDRAIISYKGALYNQFYRGNLALAIRLVPEGASLAPFEALYSLGSYRKLTGTHSLILEENSSETLSVNKKKHFSYTKFLQKASNIKELKKKKYLTSLQPYRFKMAEVLHQGILPGETALFRTVAFRSKICIEHSWTGAPVINERFAVSFEDKKLKKIFYYTNDQGCLSIVATVSHKVYKPQKYFLRRFRIFHDPDHSLVVKTFKNLNQTHKRFSGIVEVYLNPWDERIGNFGYDVRASDKNFIEALSGQKRIPSKFFIRNFSYNTLGFRYTIDDNLNLSIRKRLQLVLQPYVLRYHAVSYGREEFQRPLRDGVYLMKVAFQKTYLKPAAVGVQLTALTNPKEKAWRIKKVQSKVDSLEIKKQAVLQSLVSDLEQKDKVFLSMQVTGLSPEDIFDINLESKLLGLNTQSIGVHTAKAIEYVTAYQKLIKVQNGLIIEPVALKIDNPILMKIRGQMLIQLEAVDEKLLQIARLGDQKISIQAQNFLQKTLNNKIILKDIKMLRLLSANKNKFKSLKQFVNKQQIKLNTLLEEIKKRSISLQKKGLAHLHSIRLPKKLKSLLREFSFNKGDFDLIEENSFINIQGRSLLNPSVFLAKDSGLDKRTFLAPITLVYYDNNSYMRPTDSLRINSCGSKDCLVDFDKTDISLSVTRLINKTDTISQSGSGSKFSHEYFEHENRLADISVDDLINRQRVLWKDKALKNKSSFALYTQIYGLDYVSDYSVLESNNPCFKTIALYQSCNSTMQSLQENQKHTKTTAKFLNTEEFKNQLNSSFPSYKQIRYALTHLEELKLVSDQDIQDILTTGKINNSSVRARLCQYIKNRFSKQQLINFRLKRTGKKGISLKKHKEYLNKKTIAQLKGNYFLCDSFSFINQKIISSSFFKMYKVHKDGSSYQEGQSFNVNVGTSFNLRQSFATRLDFNPISDPAMLLGISSLKTTPFRFSFTKSVESAFTLTSQVLLSLQQSSVSFNALAYKKCTVVRIKGFSRGVVLCGKLQTKIKQFKENYFYVSQHFTPGDQLDMGALYNHPWLIRMRGQRDIMVFLNALRKDKGSDWRSVISAVVTNDKASSPINPLSSVADHPMDVLNSIKSSYQSFLPSFPGHYQILD